MVCNKAIRAGVLYLNTCGEGLTGGKQDREIVWKKTSALIEMDCCWAMCKQMPVKIELKTRKI